MTTDYLQPCKDTCTGDAWDDGSSLPTRRLPARENKTIREEERMGWLWGSGVTQHTARPSQNSDKYHRSVYRAPATPGSAPAHAKPVKHPIHTKRRETRDRHRSLRRHAGGQRQRETRFPEAPFLLARDASFLLLTRFSFHFLQTPRAYKPAGSPHLDPPGLFCAPAPSLLGKTGSPTKSLWVSLSPLYTLGKGPQHREGSRP